MKPGWQWPFRDREAHPISVVDGVRQDSDAHIARGGRPALDFAAQLSDLFRPVHRGTIVRVGWAGDCGLSMDITHEDEEGQWLIRYCHASSIMLPQGVTVSDQFVGAVGATGVAFGPHLHVIALRNGEAVRLEDYLEGEEPMARTPDQQNLIDVVRGVGTELERLNEILMGIRGASESATAKSWGQQLLDVADGLEEEWPLS